LLLSSVRAASLGTGFTYQGRLDEGANSASGNFDLRFILYNAEIGGSQVGLILTNASVRVTDGVFTTSVGTRIALAATARAR